MKGWSWRGCLLCTHSQKKRKKKKVSLGWLLFHHSVASTFFLKKVYFFTPIKLSFLQICGYVKKERKNHTSRLLRPVAGGGGGGGGGDAEGVMHPQSAKRSTFSHKMGLKWGFCRRVKGVRFKKSTFWSKRSTFWRSHTPPKKNWSWLRAWDSLPEVCDIKIFSLIMQDSVTILFKKLILTKYGNLNATNAYPQLETFARPGKLHMIDPIEYHLLTNHAPGKHGTFAWIAGTVLLQKALFCLSMNFVFQ